MNYDEATTLNSLLRTREVRNEELRLAATIIERLDKGPMRPVGRRRGIRPGGLYYSVKMGRMIGWESKAERDALFLPEVSPDILEYREQPHTGVALIKGKRRRYTPDRLDIHADGSIMITEVKDSVKLEMNDDYDEKLTYFSGIYSALGWQYQIVDRMNIEGLVNFNALKKVQSHRRVIFDYKEMNEVIKRLDRQPSSIGALLHLFQNPLAGAAKLCSMMVHRHIDIDLRTGFSEDSVVTRRADSTK